MSHVVLSGLSALSVLSAVRQNGDTIAPAVFKKDVRPPTIQEVSYLKHSSIFGADDQADEVAAKNANSPKIEVLLPSAKSRLIRDGITLTVFSYTGRGFVVSVNSSDPYFLPEDFFVASPAFVVAQLAVCYDFISAFVLALQLGGTYCISKYTGELLTDCAPLLFARQLNPLLNKLLKAKFPCAAFKNICKYFAEGAASPMETELYAKMALPTFMGGYGVDGLRMNSKIQLSNEAYKIAGQLDVRVDLLHPGSKVVVEYDSRTFHSDVDQSQRDKRRRDALQHDGYKCFSILPNQITDRETFNACMQSIVGAIKGRCRVRSRSFNANQRELFRKLKLNRNDGLMSIV